MFLKNLFQWLCGGKTSCVSSHSLRPRLSSRKTYAERYDETSEMSDGDLHRLIASRESEGLQCGVAYHIRAERAAARVRAGGKTYAERYAETSAMSRAQLLLFRAERQALGKETGVIDRVLSER